MKNRTSPLRGSSARLAAGAACALLVFACAKQMPPPGGPEDKIPPLVSGVYPAPNGLNVPVDAKIVVEFTEWMNESVNPTMLSFSPPLRKQPKVEMAGPRLTIEPRVALDPGMTYTMELSTAFADLRSNKLPAPFRLSFSTGDRIDTLSLFGSVSSEEATLPKATTVGLWPMDAPARERFLWIREQSRPASDTAARPDDATVADLMDEPAVFRATPDSLGNFSIHGLAAGRWRLAAFVDLNGNGKVDPPGEAVGLADREVVLEEGKELPPFDLSLAAVDTGLLRLESAEQLPHGLVSLAFSRGPDRATALDPARYSLVLADSGAAVPKAAAVMEDRKGGALLVLVEGAEPGRSYEFSVAGLVDSSGAGMDSAKSSATLEWALLPSDTVPVAPVGATPANGFDEALADDTLSVWFDGPVEPGDWIPRLRALFAGDTLEVGGELLGANRLRLLPPRPIAPGTEGAILLSTADTAVKRGPASADTTVTLKWRRLTAFSARDPMRVGAARICLPPHPKSRAVLRRADKAGIRPLRFEPGPDGCADLPDLAEGKYLAESYVDVDSDGRRDPGSLRPWAPAEPLFRWSDTLSVVRGKTDTLDLRAPAGAKRDQAEGERP